MTFLRRIRIMSLLTKDKDKGYLRIRIRIKIFGLFGKFMLGQILSFGSIHQHFTLVRHTVFCL